MSKRYRKRLNAKKHLNDLFMDTKNVLVIHYSCESFYDRDDGSSPRITSIAVRNLESGQTTSFSIHKSAELETAKIDMADIEKNYDKYELKMLDEFADFVQHNASLKWLHWNMRDQNYGFQAIEHRHRVLGGNPRTTVQESNKFDLSRILIGLYGVGYIGHPRLVKLVQRNKISDKDFLTGEEEAEAFNSKNYIGLHQSTLRKVDVLANVIDRVHDKRLKTNASWWERNGGDIGDLIDVVKEHPIYSVLGLLVFAIGVIKSFGWVFEKWFA